jgi:carbon storage regulator
MNVAALCSRRNVAMLVLSRKVGEKLVIGDNITIVVNRVAGNRVTIGIEAPDDVRVIRAELKSPADSPSPAQQSVNRVAGPFERTQDAASVSVAGLAK